MATILTFCLAGAVLQAGIVPIFHLDPATAKAFEDYVVAWEKSGEAAFQSTGKLWIDSSPRRDAFLAGKVVVEQKESKDVGSGSIHHYSGVVHIKGATIEQVRKVMQDYPNYQKIFKGDLGSSSATTEPDSKPEDEHFHSKLLLVQSTLWVSVTYDTLYDTHYLRHAKDRWEVRSKSISIKELTEPKNFSSKPFPEGDDHGFLWKTNTYWFARQQGDGLDLEADSLSLSRPIPSGFGWWGNKRSRDAVDKMIRDTMGALPWHQ
jgi:hypothetical protein